MTSIEQLEQEIARRENDIALSEEKTAASKAEIGILRDALALLRGHKETPSKAHSRVERTFLQVEQDEDGTMHYYNEMGDLHRKNGPALILPNGDKFWYLNGQLHCDNGPAEEYANGRKEFYLDGVIYSKPGYWNEVKRRKAEGTL